MAIRTSYKTMNEDQINFIKDMLKSEGWKLYEKTQRNAIIELRSLATQQNVKLEDRLWYSALALGKEQSLEEFNNL